jgi:hypothetical protein
MPSPEQYPCRKRVPWRVLDTEALVVDVRGGLLYPLNSVGARIWQLCDGGHTVDAIVRAVVEQFDAGEATIRSDTTTFLDELARAGLIAIHDTPPPAERRRGTTA